MNTQKISRGIPTAILVTLAIQAAGVIWGAATMNAAISTNASAIADSRARIARTEDRIEVLKENMSQQDVALGRIETSITAMLRTLDRISKNLEQQRRP